MIRSILFTAAAFLLVASCTLYKNPVGNLTVGSGNISTPDMQTIQKVFMSSYYSSSGGFPSVARNLIPFGSTSSAASHSSAPSMARATVPIGNSGAVPNNNFATLISNSAAANTIANYPETGESTTFKVTLYDSANHVYDIKSTTTFPAGDTRKTYLEEYYVKDITYGQGIVAPGDFTGGTYTPSGTWTIDDPIVEPGSVAKVQPGNASPSPSSQPWVWNQDYRVQLLLTFTDGTTRNEYIVSANNSALAYGVNSADPTFAAFNVNGSLDLSQAFVPAPATANYSSVVVYETHPATNPNFWFWAGSQAQTIVGIRYYTEQLIGSTYTGTSVSFEKTVSTNTTTSGSLATALQTVVGGSTFNTLAESVVREQISWPYVSGAPVFSQASITKNMQTRVINVTGLASFYVNQLNTDYAQISSFQTTAAYAPVGDIDTVLAGNSSALLFTGNTVQSGVSGALNLASTTAISGLGALAQAYTAITTGTLTSNSISNPPVSNIMPSSSYSFGGQQSVGLTAQSGTVNLGTTGWVEAWVYIKALTDTFGIVHYGTSTTFSDEAYSLQGWSNNGQITLCVDTTGGNYDQVLSKQLLATGKWYHIVGVWDVTSPNHYISLYINGVLDNTNTSLSQINPAGSQAAAELKSSVLIGSQLPASYSAQYGYFGLNGGIVGVNIGNLPTMVTGYPSGSNSTTAVANQVLSNYNASKNITGTWPVP